MGKEFVLRNDLCGMYLVFLKLFINFGWLKVERQCKSHPTNSLSCLVNLYSLGRMRKVLIRVDWSTICGCEDRDIG